jgi:hypothetical protein
MPFNPEPFNYAQSVLVFVAVLASCVAFVTLVATMIKLGGEGMAGVKKISRGIGEAITEFTSLSMRRIQALAVLTFKESVRRKVLLVFVVFSVLFMFAGWFMGGGDEIRPDLQVKNYIAFTLRTINWLMLPVVLLLACWGLPEDIKARSLHTVVTKPARRSEVVLGRMLGFAAIGTVVIGVMGFVGYIWIVRQVPEDAQRSLVCRVPLYGGVRFINRIGDDVKSGINVGDMWDHRSFIEGATKARAIFEFDGVTEDLANEDGSILLESRFEAFRSHKGDLNQSLLCQYTLSNPDTGVRVPRTAFRLKEFGHNEEPVPRELTYNDEQTGQETTIDLFNDLAPNGRLNVEVQCVDAGQFLGIRSLPPS